MVRKNAKILIEKALIELLVKKSLDKIDVQDIASAAGLSRQTFYYNFKNKADLISWALEEDNLAAMEAFRRNGSLYDYIYTTVSIIKQKKMLYMVLGKSDFRDCTYADFFEDGIIACGQLLERQSAQGRMSNNLWDALHFFTYGASGMVQNWVDNGLQQEPEHLAEVINRNMPSQVERYFRTSNGER